MPSLKINISRLNGMYKKIAELCDIGDTKGTLVSNENIDEISLFNNAKARYEQTGFFDINGKKYYTDGNSIFDSISAFSLVKNNPAPVDNTQIVIPSVDAVKTIENKNFIDWKGIIADNYDAKSGKALGDKAWQHRNKVPRWITNKRGQRIQTTSLGKCKQYVREDVEACYKDCTIGGQHAYEALEEFRGKNEKLSKHFIEIPVDAVPLNELPEGTVFIYDRGVAGYSQISGHIGILTNNPVTGKLVCVSDCESKLKTPTAIFIPTSSNEQSEMTIYKANVGDM